MAEEPIEYHGLEKFVPRCFDRVEIEKGSCKGLNWTWGIMCDVSTVNQTLESQHCVYFSWNFEWNELKKQGIEGFKGFIVGTYSLTILSDTTLKKFDVELHESGAWIQRKLGIPPWGNTEYSSATSIASTSDSFDEPRQSAYFKFEFSLTPLRRKIEDSPIDYFGLSDTTDAVLIVGERKFHVNKGFLSVHSEFFRALFNSNFKESSMKEIPISDLDPEEFELLLKVIYPNQVQPTPETAVILLKLADRFMLPAITSICETLVINHNGYRIGEKIVLAEQYSLEKLMETCMGSLTTMDAIRRIGMSESYEQMSDAVKRKILDRILLIGH